jgi:hypothetical protein
MILFVIFYAYGRSVVKIKIIITLLEETTKIYDTYERRVVKKRFKPVVARHLASVVK